METEAQKQARYRRIRYLKRILRPMPRRYNLHKYPILKWFAASARKRDYLWSLRDSNMIRAIYIGWFIAFIPVYGLQMILAFVFCFLLKANCLVAMALQWITNPLTIPFFLAGQYFLGNLLLGRFFDSQTIEGKIMEAFVSGADMETVKSLVSAQNLEYVGACVIVGGFLLSLIGAFLTALSYKIWSGKHSVIAK